MSFAEKLTIFVLLLVLYVMLLRWMFLSSIRQQDDSLPEFDLDGVALLNGQPVMLPDRCFIGETFIPEHNTEPGVITWLSDFRKPKRTANRIARAEALAKKRERGE